MKTCGDFFSRRRRHTWFKCDWSSDVCSSDLPRFALLSGGFIPFEGVQSAKRGVKVVDGVDAQVLAAVLAGLGVIGARHQKHGRAAAPHADRLLEDPTDRRHLPAEPHLTSAPTLAPFR